MLIGRINNIGSVSNLLKVKLFHEFLNVECGSDNFSIKYLDKTKKIKNVII
jgi:hypothetical protein